MKSFHRYVLTLSVLFAAVISFAGIAYAASANQVVGGYSNQSIYKAGATITITGTVNGDIFCTGQSITINATVNGDILCAGQAIDVDGIVNGNVRLAGQSINLNATVTRNASLVGQNIVIANSARVGQDASVAGQTATINGAISRDLTGAGNTVTLNSFIGRNVSLHTAQLTLGSGSFINGNLSYASTQPLHKNNGARVRGTVSYSYYQPHHAAFSLGFLLLAKTYWLVAMAVLAVVLVALFPRQFRKWNPSWGAHFWWLLLTGFIAMFAVPAIIIVLMLTIVGVPLGLMLLLLWIVAALLTTPLAAYFTGNLVVPKLHPVLMVLIGSVILGIIELIPVLGWITGFVVYWLGSGMLLSGLKHSYISARSEKTT